MNTKVFACAAMAGLMLATAGATPARAQYESRSRYTFAARRHLDELAYRLWQDANDVCWEMYRHYRHNPGFRVTYREMYRLMTDARHIHDLVHEGYHFGRHDVDHIARDLHDADRLFHHIEDDIRGWTSSSRGYHHYGGHYGHGYDYGHDVHGPGYRDELTRKVRYLEQTLHHLMSDYGVRSRLGDDRSSPAPQAPPEPPGEADSRPRLRGPSLAR